MTVQGPLARAASPAEVLSLGAPPTESVEAIRGLLFGGFGVGATDAQVLAATRDRAVIGQTSTIALRARTARRTHDEKDSTAIALSRLKHGAGRALLTVVVPFAVMRVLRMFR